MKNKDQIKSLHEWANVLYSIVYFPNQESEIVKSTLSLLGISTTLEENKANRKRVKDIITKIVNETYTLMQKSKHGGFQMWASDKLDVIEFSEIKFDPSAYIWHLMKIYEELGRKKQGALAVKLSDYILALSIFYFQATTDQDEPLFDGQLDNGALQSQGLTAQGTSLAELFTI